jgi:serine/threonine-protein kinase
LVQSVRTALRRGSQLGKYRLEARIGRGAFSDVWRATDLVERRRVALKVAHADAVAEWGRDELEREARIAARLEHPNIVAIRNADWIDGRFVLASDLGRTNLDAWPAARRSARTALRVIRDAARGLAHAHAQRIMHRDVKPENVLILRDGRAAICDFGVSRFARSAAATYTEAGTLGFIAPEQAYGRPTLGSDVFSLGVIAWELLTGVRPSWPFDWPPQGHARFRARVPEPVQRVLRRAMEFDPRRRWPDAVAFSAALEEAVGRAEAQGRARPRLRRRRRPAAEPSPLALQAAWFARLHGRALGLRYRCRRCDGPIAEAMNVCPWCGTGDQSFLGVTDQPLVCPECERGVRPDWSACPWCHAGRFEPSAPPRPDPRAVRRCARRGCRGELRPFMRYCPACKQKARRPWSHPDLPDRCPRCRWPVSKRYFRFCPWCARRHRDA